MGTPEEILNSNWDTDECITPDLYGGFCRAIEQAQKEAWNEATLKAAEDAKYKIDFRLIDYRTMGETIVIDKQSILKNLIK